MGLFGACRVVLGKGGLVEEEVGILDMRHIVGVETRVATVDVLPWWGCRCGEEVVGDYFSLLGDVVLSILDAIYLAEGDVVEVYHLTLDMSSCGLFLEYEAATRYAMAEWKGLYAHRTVFIDDVGASVWEGMECHFVGHALAEEVELRA